MSRDFHTPEDFEPRVQEWKEGNLDIFEIECEDLVDRTDDLFALGIYDDPRSRKNFQELECRTCGGREFNVGRDGAYTAVRCTTCDYEVLVHEG